MLSSEKPTVPQTQLLRSSRCFPDCSAGARSAIPPQLAEHRRFECGPAPTHRVGRSRRPLWFLWLASGRLHFGHCLGNLELLIRLSN